MQLIFFEGNKIMQLNLNAPVATFASQQPPPVAWAHLLNAPGVQPMLPCTMHASAPTPAFRR